MTLLGNYLEDRLKVLAYSTSQAQTAGNGEEGRETDFRPRG